MVEAYKKFFNNYANFKGCLSRGDFLRVYLVNIIISAVLAYILPSIVYIYELGILIPTIAVGVRRMHDVNKSGWYLLMILIPLVGWIILIIALAYERKEPNNYGTRI